MLRCFLDTHLFIFFHQIKSQNHNLYSFSKQRSQLNMIQIQFAMNVFLLSHYTFLYFLSPLLTCFSHQLANPDTKNLSQQVLDANAMPYMDTFKKLKRFRLFESSLGILGFLFITVCLICGFFYLDYTSVGRADHQERFMWLKFGGSVDRNRRRKVDFFSEKGDGCDLFEGDWVWDETYPLYQSKHCAFLDQGFRCSENGRPDLFYTKWRWQPKYCNLPRFNARKMLEKLRNKRLVFVGDSIGKNQWESLLCMLTSAVTNKDSIYEVNDNPITKHKGFLVFKFMDYNCTLEYYRAPFLVLQSRPPPDAPPKVRTTLKLDQMDWTFLKWQDAEILVFNTGHWWNYEKTTRGGCYFQEGAEVKMDMEVDSAYWKSIETVVAWIEREVNKNKTQVFFRTYAPVHFRGRDWRAGGNCHMETLPDLSSSLVPSHTWSQYSIFLDVISNRSDVKDLSILYVTNMTSRRKDGHSSLYYLGPKLSPASIRRWDCSHWCLPGVPDTWNELLYSLFLKRKEAINTPDKNLSATFQALV